MDPATATPPATATLPKTFHFEEIELVPVVRAADGEGAEAVEEDVFDLVISTETPCDTFSGTEVFSHEKSAVDMSIARKGLSLYLEHGGYPARRDPDPGLHIGIVEDIKLGDDKKLRGRMRFSAHALAQRVKQDVKDRTMRFVSVRGLPLKRRLTKSAPDAPGNDRCVWTRWRPEEVSIVGIPADPNAGIARSASAEQFPVETEVDTEALEPITRAATDTQEEANMDPVTPTPAAPTAGSPAAVADPPAQVSITRSAAPPADIMRLCEAAGLSITRAAQFVEKGMTLAEAKAALFDERVTSTVRAQPPAEASLDAVPEKDRRRFSVARAVQMSVAVREGSGKFDGLEAGVSEELARQAPSTYRGIGGHFLPMSLLSSEERAERDYKRSVARAMGTNVAGGGSELVFDRAGDLIDMLRNRMLTSRFGAGVLSGLTGPVQFPVQTGDPTAYFVSENPAVAAAQSQLTFTTRTLSPKEAIAVVPFPRRLLNMASVDIEGRVRASLIAKHALLWDLMGLHGRGTDGEPTGIYNTPGVGTVAFGGTVPTYGKLVDLGGAIADANADDDSMRYMTHPLMAAKLKQVLVASAAGSGFIWGGKYRDGEMCGYQAGATKQISRVLGAGADEVGIVFGDWAKLTYGIWGALEFITDVVTLADKGQIKITTNQLGDNVVERPEAFAVATGAKLA